MFVPLSCVCYGRVCAHCVHAVVGVAMAPSVTVFAGLLGEWLQSLCVPKRICVPCVPGLAGTASCACVSALVLTPRMLCLLCDVSSVSLCVFVAALQLFCVCVCFLLIACVCAFCFWLILCVFVCVCAGFFD